MLKKAPNACVLELLCKGYSVLASWRPTAATLVLQLYYRLYMACESLLDRSFVASGVSFDFLLSPTDSSKHATVNCATLSHLSLSLTLSLSL